jgi:hypothetical protein
VWKLKDKVCVSLKAYFISLTAEVSQKIANIVIRTTVNLTFYAMFFSLIYRTCAAFTIIVRHDLQANTTEHRRKLLTGKFPRKTEKFLLRQCRRRVGNSQQLFRGKLIKQARCRQFFVAGKQALPNSFHL